MLRTRTIVFEDEFGIRSVALAFSTTKRVKYLADIKSVSPPVDLVDGMVYKITLRYQDASETSIFSSF